MFGTERNSNDEVTVAGVEIAFAKGSRENDIADLNQSDGGCGRSLRSNTRYRSTAKEHVEQNV